MYEDNIKQKQAIEWKLTQGPSPQNKWYTLDMSLLIEGYCGWGKGKIK